MLDLDEKYIDEIKRIVFQYVDKKKNKVFIFGSRVNGKNKKFSDVDVGIEGERVKSSHLVEMRCDFADSDIPYIVEVVDFNLVSEDFMKVAKESVYYLN